MEYDEFEAMNTDIQIAAEGNPEDLWEGFKQVKRFITESEARFSRFREDSELCRLNRSTGTFRFQTRIRQSESNLKTIAACRFWIIVQIVNACVT